MDGTNPFSISFPGLTVEATPENIINTDNNVHEDIYRNIRLGLMKTMMLHELVLEFVERKLVLLLMRLFLCCWWLAPIHSPLSLLMHHLEIL
jgi:hypothetical protein